MKRGTRLNKILENKNIRPLMLSFFNRFMLIFKILYVILHIQYNKYKWP